MGVVFLGHVIKDCTLLLEEGEIEPQYGPWLHDYTLFWDDNQFNVRVFELKTKKGRGRGQG